LQNYKILAIIFKLSKKCQRLAGSAEYGCWKTPIRVILLQVERQQVEMELGHPSISPDCPDRVERLVTCHPDPYSAAADGTITQWEWSYSRLFVFDVSESESEFESVRSEIDWPQ
jgi:hypothetical protein